MLAVFKQGFRVINKLAVADCVGVYNPSILSSSSYGSYKHFDYCMSQRQNWDKFLGAFQLETLNKAGSLIPELKYQTQNISISNLHTSSSLNSYEGDYGDEEKRNAKILLWTCITFTAAVAGLYFFIDLEEYDRPTVVET